MTDKEQVEKWFNEFWCKYPLDLCQNRRGGRPLALRAALKLKPDEKEQKRIEACTKAKAVYDRKAKKAGEFVETWPHVSTYFNQGRYDDGIPSTAELKHKAQAKQCSFENCPNEVHGGDYNVCTDHLQNESSTITEAFKKESLKKCGYWKRSDETVKEWQHRCHMSLKGKSGNLFRKMDF